jgi:acylphosphatase
MPQPAKVPSKVHERREIHFSGRVQGVGFRFAVRSIAARYRVTGFVQNLYDGRVLLVAEGEPKELDVLVNDIRREMKRYVESEQSTVAGATGEFADFSIRH